LLVGEQPEATFDLLSHDELVGVKCMWKRECASSQAATDGLVG
jgi:hypothetical protein